MLCVLRARDRCSIIGCCAFALWATNAASPAKSTSLLRVDFISAFALSRWRLHSDPSFLKWRKTSPGEVWNYAVCWCHRRVHSPNVFSVLLRVEKYRPQTLDDLISHKDILSTSKSHQTRNMLSGCSAMSGCQYIVLLCICATDTPMALLLSQLGCLSKGTLSLSCKISKVCKLHGLAFICSSFFLSAQHWVNVFNKI